MITECREKSAYPLLGKLGYSVFFRYEEFYFCIAFVFIFYYKQITPEKAGNAYSCGDDNE